MMITEADAPRLLPAFRGKKGRLLFRLAMKVSGLDKANRLHDRVEKSGAAPGADFAHGLLQDCGIDFAIGNPERLEQLPEGAFIVIANHVYGHIDGICLVDLFAHKRPAAKVMVNEFLMWVKGIKDNFIPVNPVTDSGGGATPSSIGGIRQALAQLHSGEPLCIFPSGAVADIKPREGWTLSERPWQESAIRLIRKARVPILPLRFFDSNSRFYYLLGLLDFRIRFIRLFHELWNKRGSHPRLGIGPLISVEQQDAVPEADFGAFLRSSVYDMPLPGEFTYRSQLWKKD